MRATRADARAREHEHLVTIREHVDHGGPARVPALEEHHVRTERDEIIVTTKQQSAVAAQNFESATITRKRKI